MKIMKSAFVLCALMSIYSVGANAATVNQPMASTHPVNGASAITQLNVFNNCQECLHEECEGPGTMGNAGKSLICGICSSTCK